MSSTAPLHAEYRTIPPEPWGRRLKRAREDVAELTLEPAVAKAGEFMLTSTSTISRLEDRTDMPTKPSQRQLAFVLCVVYQVDPAEFGLSSSDVPPGWRIDPAARSEEPVTLQGRHEEPFTLALVA